LADNLGLIIQVNYTDSQRNIDKAITKLQEYVSTKKLHISFDAESIKGLDQISKFISPAISQTNNLNSSFKDLSNTVNNLNKESKINFFSGGKLTQTKEIKEMEDALGKLHKVTKTFSEGNETHRIVEDTTNYKKQRDEVDKLANSMANLREKSEIRVKTDANKSDLAKNTSINKNIEKENLDRIKAQQNASDMARKLIVEEETKRLNTTTETQKRIEQAILGSNETVSQQQIRMNSVNGHNYEQIWHKAFENKRLEEEKLAQKQIENTEKTTKRQQQLYAGLFNQTEKSIQQQANLLNTRMQSALGLGVKVNGLSPESSRVLESQLERYKNIIKQFQGKNELGINIRPEQLTQLQNLENRIKRFYETIRQGQNDSHGFNFTQYDQFTRLNPAITNATQAQQYYNTSLLEGHRLIASNIQQTEQYIRVTQQLRNGSQHLNLGVYIDRATGQMYQFNEALRDGMTRSWGLGEAMSTAATKAMVWSVVMGTMYSFLNILQQIPTAIIEINTRLVEMSKVMSSDTDYGVLMDNLSKSANAYGRTITETQNAVIEFGKQGFEAAQATDMANTALLGANVTGLKTAEMAQYLTATMAQFNVVAEDSVSIVNKINEVDNNFAVTSQGLAQSLAKAGESAQIYGATLDDVIGYTTAIQTATKESGNVIGNSLKTTISRTFSTDSEKALAGVGIAIKDISGNVRDVNQIWGELAVKFKTLSSEQKQQIGLTIGSRYHLTRFLALMDNWQIVTDATTTSQRSLFSALEENRKHLGSLESQINKVKSAGQELSYVLGESGLKSVMYGVLSGTTLLINGLTELSNMGAFGTVAITALVVTMGGLLIKTLSLIPALKAATVALKAFTLATLTNPWIIAGTAILAIIVGIVSYFGHTKQVREEQEKLNKTLNDSTKNFNALAESINKVGAPTLQNINDIEAQIKRYDELTEAILKSKDAESKKIIKTVDPRTMQVSLQKKNIPDEVIDLAANLRIDIGAFKTYDKLLSEITKKQRELADSTEKAKKNSTEYQAQQIKLSQTSLDVANNTNDLVNEYKELSSITEKNEQQTKRYSEVKNMLLAMFPEEFKNGKITIALLEEESKKRVELAEKSLGQSRTQLIENAKSTQSAYETAVKNMAMYQAEIDMLNSLWASRSNNAGSTGNWRLSEDLGMAQYNFGETKKEANSLADAISKMNDVLNWKPASVAGIGDDKKESGSSKDKKEKELSIESTTQALINQIEQEHLLQKAKSESIQKDLTQAQSQKDYAKTLELTNSLITSQAQELSLLQTARSKINQLKDSAISSSSSQFGNVSDRWFTGSDNQESASFIEEKNRASEDTRKIMDETFKSLQLLRNAWMDNKKLTDENAEASKALKNSLIQIEIEKFEQSMTDLDKKINLSKSSMDLYDKSSEEYSKEQAKQITILKEKEDAIFNEIVTIGHLLKATDLTTESQKALNEEMANLKLTLNQNQKSLQDYANDIVQTLKDAAKIRKTIDLAVIDVEMRSEDRRHQQVLDDIDIEEKAREDSINKQIDAIDRLANAENYTKDLNSAQTDAQTIQDQINIFKNDTSYEGKAKLAELQAQLAEKNSDIEDMQNAHTIDLRKQNLQDALDAIKKELEAKKQSENEAYEAKKQSLEDQKTDIETAFNELMLKDEIWSAKVQEILDGNIMGIKESLNIFADEFTTTLTTQAGKIDTSFQAIINTIKQIKSAANELDAFPNYASGTNYHPKDGLAITSEKGRELISPPNGRPFLSGNNGPEIMNLEKGTEVLPNNLTEQLISKAKLLNIPSYSNGTGINGNGSLMDLIKNLPSVLPNISLQPFKMPQLANTIATSITSNPTITFNVTAGKDGLSKKELHQAAEFVFKDISKILKK